MTCKTCRWWIESQMRPNTGYCTRFPPSIPINPNSGAHDGCEFPITYSTTACGEWGDNRGRRSSHQQPRTH